MPEEPDLRYVPICKPQGMERFLAAIAPARLSIEIQEALDCGWSLSTIWKQLQDEQKFEGSYQAFWRAWEKASSPSTATKKAQEAATEARDASDGPRIVSEQPSCWCIT